MEKPKIDWQPLIDAAAGLVSSRTVMVMLLGLYCVALFGPKTTEKWIEAVGAQAAFRLLGIEVNVQSPEQVHIEAGQ